MKDPEGEGHGKSKAPINYFGKGVISKRGNQFVYNGTLPFKDGDKVAVITQGDLELLVRGTLTHLFMTRSPMHQKAFEQFPDSLEYSPNAGEPTMLYLDRHFFTMAPDRQMLVRYISVDEAQQEGEFDDAGDSQRS